jgi:uncharacterized protein YqcC (DUF446 family)
MEAARPTEDLHAKIAAIADALEAELRRLGRWSAQQPPPEAFENMGAFGGRTLAFEQWIQFVLLERIREIVSTSGVFPSGSQVGVYAVRELDGDPDAGELCSLLSTLDWVIEHRGASPPERAPAPEPEPAAGPGDPNRQTITLGDTTLPAVIHTLIGVLPQFEGEDLEDQLRTYDTFLHVLSPVVRPALSALLRTAAAAAKDPASRARIERAARDVAAGGHAGGD